MTQAEQTSPAVGAAHDNPFAAPEAERQTAILTLFRRCLTLINRETYPQAAGLIALMVIGAGLEVIGIGLIFPLVAVLSDPSMLTKNEWTRPYFADMSPENQPAVLVLIAVGFLGTIGFKNAFLLLVFYVQGHFFNRNEAILARELFSRYLHGDYRLHLMRNSADLINNVTSTASTVFSHALRSFMTIGSEALLIAALGIVLLIANPLVTLGALGTIAAAMLIFYAVIRNRMSLWGRQSTDARRQIIKVLQQGLHSLKEVKVLGREDFVLKSFEVPRQTFAAAETKTFVANNAPRLWVETVVIACAMLGVVSVVLHGGPTSELFSILALFAAAAVRLIPSMNRILIAMNAIRGGTYPVNVVYEDLRIFGVANGVSAQPNTEITITESLVLDSVTFSYPGADRPALYDIDLTVPKGTSLGLVGPSGGGKTTLVDIILGLMPPDRGRILVDGKDIADNVAGWCARLSYVPQSVYLLDDTVRRNIAFAIRDDEISDASMTQAIQLAQLEDFVAALPDGLDTVVGERGARLSGGQRQRVGIARALYRDPEVLVLDEATSALDSETERQITKVLGDLRGKKTVITIAHRLSTVRQCDMLAFLDNGRIVHTGSFEELTERDESFRNLVELSKL